MLASMKYILDGKVPKKVDNVFKWAAWYETADRTVKLTKLPDNIIVSTVFTALDPNFFIQNAVPRLFETMIFGGEHDLWQRKYTTWEEAEAGHEEAIKMIFEVIPDR